MELIEYQTKLKQLEADYKLARQKLIMEYGLSLALYKKGDIIKDNEEIILIDKISVDVTFSEVNPVYRGFLLNKNLSEKKNRSRGSIYGNKNTELIKAGNI